MNTEKWALISGASSGIGRELARVSAADGYHVIISARRESRLQALAEELRAKGSSVRIIPCDLSHRESAKYLHEEVQKMGIQIDMLVNNAGFGDCHLFRDAQEEKLMQMIQVNVSTLVALTHLFLPTLLSRPQAAILNVASVAAFQPGPGMAVYYASKAFVLSFSEALAEELSHSSVKVSALCPGPTHSEFSITAESQSSPIFNERILSDTRKVAAYGYKALLRGRPVVIYGFLFKILTFIQRLLPRSWVSKITGKLQASRSASSSN